MSERTDDDGAPLEVGCFYWVMPVADVDLRLEPDDLAGAAEGGDEYYSRHFNHWTQQTQPARYAGRDGKGEEMWWYLGQSGDGPYGAQAYPVRWVGKKITPPA